MTFEVILPKSLTTQHEAVDRFVVSIGARLLDKWWFPNEVAMVIEGVIYTFEREEDAVAVRSFVESLEPSGAIAVRPGVCTETIDLSQVRFSSYDAPK